MIRLEPVGYVRSARSDLRDDDWGAVTARIELAPDVPSESLDGLEAFSHAEVIFHFHRVPDGEVTRGARHPRENPAWPKVGVFAQRGKSRPNRLGSTIVGIRGRSERALEVVGLDAIDGTPVLDIKPVMQELLPRGPVRQPPWSHELMRAYWSAAPSPEALKGSGGAAPDVGDRSPVESSESGAVRGRAADAEIRRLAPPDAEAFLALRREALVREPLAFAASPSDDVALAPEHVRASLASATQATLGVFAPGLVGVVGVARGRHEKASHKAQVFGLYVVPGARRRGLGARLVHAALEFARGLPGVSAVHLSVSEPCAAALALYEGLGFATWATEPDALRVGGRSVGLRHMVLPIGDEAGGEGSGASGRSP
jgi:tRNA (adenine37-N6)-methyltransferase